MTQVTAALSAPGADIYEVLSERFERYKANLTKLCGILSENNVKVIICTPAPYDEYSDGENVPIRGAYALMLAYADYVGNFAKENSFPLCDMHKYMSKEMIGKSLYNPDRVHPSDRGHYEMAKCFLSFQGLDIGDYSETPHYLDSWRSWNEKLRNIYMAEFLLICDYSKKTEQKLDFISDYISNERWKGSGCDECFESIAKRYAENKPKQAEIEKCIINFMENEF